MNDTNSTGQPAALPGLAEATGSAESPADICLWKTTTMVPEEFVYAGRTQVSIEKRAWVCPLCGQSEEYYLLNGLVVHGLGKAVTMGGGVSIYHCSRWRCTSQANERVEAAMQAMLNTPDHPRSP